MKIAFLGDLALIGKYDLSKNPNAKSSLKEIAHFLKSYDYVIGNLESPLTDRTRSTVPKSMHLRSPKVNVELLKFLNINFVSLANNHSYDFGRKGIDDTIKVLNKNGIEYFGIDNRSIPIINATLSGYCCYSTNAVGYNSASNTKGVNTLDYTEVIKQIEQDKASNKITLLSIHWGDEHTNYPKFDHIQFARLLSQKNNIVVSGHHPHVVQGIEKVNDSIIAYSQGNFCFDDCEAISGTGMKLIQNEENRESFILEVNISQNKIESYKTIGIKEIDNRVVFNPIDTKLSRISEELTNISDRAKYQENRILQFSDPQFRMEKFGKKDIKWYFKRLNYYAIGAYLLGKINKRKYNSSFDSHI
jgi:poly-gamma-glutamate synthesis protein (capsule biosynthesis protein)